VGDIIPFLKILFSFAKPVRSGFLLGCFFVGFLARLSHWKSHSVSKSLKCEFIFQIWYYLLSGLGFQIRLEFAENLPTVSEEEAQADIEQAITEARAEKTRKRSKMSP